MFNASKQIQIIEKAFVVVITNFFVPEQGRDGAGEVN